MEIHLDHLEEIPPEHRDAIEARIRGLAEGHEDLIDVRIVGQTTRHHRHGASEVHLSCQARGQEIVAKRSRDDLALALDEVVDAFEREVRRMRGRRLDRRSERLPVPPYLGLVDRILRDEGYGSILTDSGESVYFHRNAVSGGLDFDRLEEGQRVGLNIEQGDEGPQATVVVRPPPGVPAP